MDTPVNKCVACKHFSLFEGWLNDYYKVKDHGICLNPDNSKYIFGIRNDKINCKYYDVKPKRSLLNRVKGGRRR